MGRTPRRLEISEYATRQLHNHAVQGAFATAMGHETAPASLSCRE